jgi:phage terminase large subunit-like protein
VSTTAPRWQTPVPPEDVERGDGADVAEFIETFCSVTQDTFAGPAGSPMVLRPWQRDLLGGLLARRPDGRRRHRVALVGMPRKQGKSGLSAGIALDGLFAGRGSEIYSVAADREQARIVFGHARRMVEASPELSSRCRVYRDAIDLSSTSSVYRCISSEVFCVVPDTIVDLPDGTRRAAGDLTVGPIVGVVGTRLVNDWVDAAGSRPASPCYTVRTHRGRAVTATADHPFLVRSDRDYHGGADHHEWRRVDSLAVGDRVVVGMGWPEDYEGKPLAPGEAWTMGAWVGDGCNTKLRFTNVDSIIINGVRDFLLSLGADLRVTTNPQQWQMVSNGVRPSPGRLWVRRHFGETKAYDKRVPEAVMTGSPSDWAAFLAGFLDTDGCVPIPRAYVKWNSASRGLLGDCQALLARLGVNASLGPVKVTYRGEVRTYHELRVCGQGQMRMLADLLPVRHSGKRRRLERFPYAARLIFRAWDSDKVISVEPAGDYETAAISVQDTAAHVTGGLVSHNTKEGLSPNLVIFDEVHAQPNDELWHVMALASGARKDPLLLGITTAGVRTDITGQDSICYRLFQYGQQVASGEVDDPTFYMAWWAALDEADHRDPAVWSAANPALGDLLDPEDMASAVGRTPENEFRTKRLNQWVSSAVAWLPSGSWEALTEERSVPDGAEVVLAFDGSYNNDSTALVVCEVGERPHLDVAGLWERPRNAPPEWSVPILDVEDAIRHACARWRVSEVVCDPFRWARSYQILGDEGLPIVEYPQSSTRMTPATQRFYEAVMNRTLSHSGDPRLARHLTNAVLKVDSRGQRIVKETKNSPRKIDLAVAAVMAFDRAAYADTHYDLLNSIHIG